MNTSMIIEQKSPPFTPHTTIPVVEKKQIRIYTPHILVPFLWWKTDKPKSIHHIYTTIPEVEKRQIKIYTPDMFNHFCGGEKTNQNLYTTYIYYRSRGGEKTSKSIHHIYTSTIFVAEKRQIKIYNVSCLPW